MILKVFRWILNFVWRMIDLSDFILQFFVVIFIVWNVVYFEFFFVFFFIIIEDDNDCIYSMKKLIAIFRNKEIWKMSCIFINCDKFNWQAYFNIFLTLYDLIHLWFNFLEKRFVFMFWWIIIFYFRRRI